MHRSCALILLGLIGPTSLAAQWRVLRHTDEMTDQPTTAFVRAATSPILGGAGQPVRPELLLRCTGGAVEAAYLVHKAILPERGVTITSLALLAGYCLLPCLSSPTPRESVASFGGQSSAP